MPDRANIKMDKPKTNARPRVAAHITETPSSAFGIEVQVNRQPVRKSDFSPSGDGAPGQVGLAGNAARIQPGNQNYREVIPPGSIGTEEKYDEQLPPPQYVDTKPWVRDEEKAPYLHGAREALNVSDTKGLPFNQYGSFQPRTAPLPRARQDEGVLGSLATMSADPLMTDEDSFTMIIPRDDPRRKDLYGRNRDGMLHNDPAPTGAKIPTSKAVNISEQALGPVQTARLPKTVRRPTTSMQAERSNYVKR